MLESLNKVAGLKVCSFVKKRIQQRYSPVNIKKFSRTSFFRTSLMAASENNTTT